MKSKALIVAVSSALLAGGCASYDPAPVTDSSELNELRTRLTQQEAEESRLRSELAAMERSRNAVVEAGNSSDNKGSVSNTMADLPVNAKAGECYARVFEPPQYTTENRQVLKRAASEQLEIFPATYTWTEETVMTRPKGVRLETVPARYEWAEQTVTIEPARTELIEVPAKYGTETEEVLVRAAYTTWKKGRGPIERINEATGEIMCLVEVPAEYKTVTRTVMTAAPTTREEVISAKTKVVRTQVLVEPARTVEVEIPAQYETVKVRKLANAAREQRTAIPEEYQTLTETKLVKEGKLRWQSILCETNASPALITRVQRNLNKSGFDAGQADGILGASTMRAISDYQRANGLASGQLTIETLEKLGVEI